jgi:hypothetical protein
MEEIILRNALYKIFLIPAAVLSIRFRYTVYQCEEKETFVYPQAIIEHSIPLCKPDALDQAYKKLMSQN